MLPLVVLLMVGTVFASPVPKDHWQSLKHIGLPGDSVKELFKRTPSVTPADVIDETEQPESPQDIARSELLLEEQIEDYTGDRGGQDYLLEDIADAPLPDNNEDTSDDDAFLRKRRRQLNPASSDDLYPTTVASYGDSGVYIVKRKKRNIASSVVTQNYLSPDPELDDAAYNNNDNKDDNSEYRDDLLQPEDGDYNYDDNAADEGKTKVITLDAVTSTAAYFDDEEREILKQGRALPEHINLDDFPDSHRLYNDRNMLLTFAPQHRTFTLGHTLNTEDTASDIGDLETTPTESTTDTSTTTMPITTTVTDTTTTHYTTIETVTAAYIDVSPIPLPYQEPSQQPPTLETDVLDEYTTTDARVMKKKRQVTLDITSSLLRNCY